MIRNDMDKELSGSLRGGYGIEPDSILPTKGGWSADAWVVEAAGSRYFLKVYDKTRRSVLPWIRRMPGYLPVYVCLAEDPVLAGHLPALHATVSGDLHLEEEHRILQLYNYIDGYTVGNRALTHRQVDELAAIMARLHSLRIPLPVPERLLRESLSLDFCQNLGDALADPQRLSPDVRDALLPVKGDLERAVHAAFALRDRFRDGCRDLVLCHTDAHGGNLRQGERLMLLDWEGLCLAPAEADLFLFAEEDWYRSFKEAYCSLRPGFVPSEGLLLFYRLRRRLEDLWEYAAQLSYDPPDRPETAEAALRQLRLETAAAVALTREIPAFDEGAT